jgi:ribosomal-protein-alanine N-acetyltransferase
VSDGALSICLGPMDLADVEQVVAIDRLSFPIPWSAASYRREISENDHSHFFVAYLPAAGPNQGKWWARWRPAAEANRRIVGYIGYWHVADEAHISTIAVHPDFRRHKIGVQLLAVMLRHALKLGATLATLEVRVTNSGAQRLYRNYGFEVVGTRKSYYRDNGEDALLMSLAPISSALPHLKRWEAPAQADCESAERTIKERRESAR